MKRRFIAALLCVAAICMMAIPASASAADLGTNPQITLSQAAATTTASARAVHAWYYCKQTAKVWSGKGSGTLYGYIYKGTTVDATSASGNYIYVVNGSLSGWADVSYFTFQGYSY